MLKYKVEQSTRKPQETFKKKKKRSTNWLHDYMSENLKLWKKAHI